jgi:hypothetical protein
VQLHEGCRIEAGCKEDVQAVQEQSAHGAVCRHTPNAAETVRPEGRGRHTTGSRGARLNKQPLVQSKPLQELPKMQRKPRHAAGTLCRINLPINRSACCDLAPCCGPANVQLLGHGSTRASHYILPRLHQLPVTRAAVNIQLPTPCAALACTAWLC